MAVSSELFSAILAMDAYNRGYNAGLNNLSDAADGTAQLGLATIVENLETTNLLATAQAASFYALAYDVGNVAGFAADGPMFLAIFEACIGRPFDLPRAAGGGPQACARVPRNRSGNSGQIRRAP
ncbi:MAG: hypothetical protein NW217_06490, partial [Hyphomicrobiaceae bacterium]|nr:hypothetical protein [Hyphomicrobiaceae bacterium]